MSQDNGGDGAREGLFSALKNTVATDACSSPTHSETSGPNGVRCTAASLEVEAAMIASSPEADKRHDLTFRLENLT